jgi:hypothetical protein
VGTVTGLFGRRYCELFLVNAHSNPITSEVWNSYPLNEYLEASWRALDPADVAAQRGSPLAVRNGLRYWAVDSITKHSAGPLETANLGGIEMHRDAVLRVGTLSTTAYVDHAVERNTVFRYDTGRKIYELESANGSTYVMQSWSQQMDPTLGQADLARLGSRPHLPVGWTFRTRVFSSPLRIVTTNTPAIVLQDDLGNTYSLES